MFNLTFSRTNEKMVKKVMDLLREDSPSAERKMPSPPVEHLTDPLVGIADRPRKLKIPTDQR